MSKFATNLQKWTALSSGDDNYDRGGGGGGGRESKPSSIELLTLDSEFTREQSKNSLSSVWKPVWYTGWHTGVLACASSVAVVLLINVALTIYAATNPEYKMERGIGTLYSGSCRESRAIGLLLHLGINALSTLLLSGSNYTQQCLAAPTRSEVDAAHAKRRWMDIGVPSVRNLFMIKAERKWLWIAIGITSVPLHLMYNSAVYTSLAANQYFVAAVTNNHFAPGAYSNGAEALYKYQRESSIGLAGKKYGDIGHQTYPQDMQLFASMLDGYNASTQRYEDLPPSLCAKLYNTDFLSDRRNLFLITNYTSASTFNSTLLRFLIVRGDVTSPSSWICPESLREASSSSRCDTNGLISMVASGLPWLVTLRTGEEVEVTGCKSEIAKEKCKVQFSLGIMSVVICCNLVKACGMIMTVVRSREPTLVTLGDAVDSFLRIPDPTTTGICFADREFIGKGRREWRTGPRQWKQKEVQRWRASVSKMRWLTCNILCSITIVAAGALLGVGLEHEADYFSIDIKSLWTRGFGTVNSVSRVGFNIHGIAPAIILANLPQTILSFLYLTYNSLFTCMLSGHEWSLFGHHHRTLRVTSPRPGQRSTYWLQLPYTYAIPLMALSGLLHWLTSQSLFLARVEVYDPFGGVISTTISTVGYSCIAIICVLTLGILALLTATGMGYRKFAAEITTVGSCSAAISAACHARGADSEGIVGRKVRWGDVGIALNPRVRHLTFSSQGGVKKPVLGEVYAGTGG